MALSPHRNSTHKQPSRWQQKCGHGPQVVRMKPWVGMRPQIGEDMASDRDKTLGCGDGTPCCTCKEVEVECVCQGMSETGNVSHPSAHGTPTDLWNGRSRGRIPAECLEQKMLYAYATVCTQGGFTLSRK